VGVTCEDLVLGRGAFRLSANWSLPSGASLALIGPSGAGKSLFLGGLAGFETVHQGRVLIHKKDATALAPSDRQLTLMFQNHNLFPHLTVFQNVALGITPSLKLSDEAATRVETKADFVSVVSDGEVGMPSDAEALFADPPEVLRDYL